MVTGESSPGCRSTATARTPGRADSSLLTAAVQWPQVMPATVISVWVVWLIGCLLGRGWSAVGAGRYRLGVGSVSARCRSAAHEAGDRVGRFADLLGRGLVGLASGVDDAVRHVVLEQAE